jgi:hypothetical protein
LTEDINQRTAIPLDHQLPAYDEERPRHGGLKVIIWSLFLLALVVVVVLIYRHHGMPSKRRLRHALRRESPLGV